MTGEWRRASAALAITALLAVLAAGCQKPVLSDLEEGKAGQVMSILRRHGIPASKKADNEEANTWRVLVPSEQEGRALDLLNEYNLLSPPERGFREIFSQRSTISTATEETALFLEAKQGELSRSLQIIDRILDARVQISPAERQYGELVSPAKASVVVVYQPTEEGTWPISEREVQNLIADGVPDLSPERVTVVMKTANIAAPPRLQDGDWNLVSVGGLLVADSSVNLLKVILGAALLLLGTLAGFVYWQSRLIGELRRELTLARTGYMPSEQALTVPPEELSAG